MASTTASALNKGCRDIIEDRGPSSDENAIFLSKLTQTIEGEIIPRLLLTHTSNPTAKEAGTQEWVSDLAEVEVFSHSIIAPDSSSAFRSVERAKEGGRPIEHIITGLLAPSATYLGELWKADKCSFTEVTIGLSRLRQILRELAPEFETEKDIWRHGRRALLLPAPGEQHTFGIFVVEAFFRREGWDVYGGPVDSEIEIARLVESQWFAIAGFSVSCDRFLKRLPPLIGEIRRRSCNSGIGILVGGPLFLVNPSLVAEVGADGGAADAKDALLQAGSLLARASANQ